MTGLKKLLMWKAASGGSALQTETLSGSLVTFETSKARPLQQCRVDFLPVQSGSGDPSPENVRPISGWDGCTVYASGINVFDGELESGRLNNSGQDVSSKDNIRSKNYISVVPGKSYRLVYTIIESGTPNMSTSNMKVHYYDRSKTYLSSIWRSPVSTTVPDNAYYIRFYMDTLYSAGANRDIAINYPASDTSYHPYTGLSYPITWQSAGTVYGGYVDLVRGVLVAEWSNIASYDGETLPGAWISDRDIYASGTMPTIGAQVAYQLATPITYTLTPQQITTLIGTNNIWSDAGDVTVTYTK